MMDIIRTFSSGWDHFTSATKNLFAVEPSMPNTDDWKKDYTADPVAKWGSNNLFPRDLDAAVSQTDVVEAVLQDLTCFAYQDDLMAFEKKVIGNELVHVPIIYEGLELLRESCDLDTYFEKTFYDFFRYGNTWAQPIMDENRSKFVFVSAIDAPLCRNQKKQGKGKVIENVYVSGQWANGIKITAKLDKNVAEHVEIIPTISPLDDLEIIKAGKSLKYMFHISDYSPGNVYYGEAPWHSLLRNEWLTVNKNIPVKLNAFYEKAIQLNYHIEADYGWIWESLYGKGTWDNAPVDKKIAFVNEMHTSVDENLKGEDKSYTSIFTEFKHVRGEDSRSALKINVLQNFTKDSLIPDAQQSISEIFLAMRYDPSLINSGMFGSKLGAGSGSDKDQGFKLLDIRMHLARKKALRPLQFMMRYNDPSRTNIVLGFPRSAGAQSETNQKSKNTVKDEPDI